MSSGVGFFSDWLPGHELKNAIGVSLRLECWAPLAPTGMSKGERVAGGLGRRPLSTQPRQSPFVRVLCRDRVVCDFCLTEETKRLIVGQHAHAVVRAVGADLEHGGVLAEWEILIRLPRGGGPYALSHSEAPVAVGEAYLAKTILVTPLWKAWRTWAASKTATPK